MKKLLLYALLTFIIIGCHMELPVEPTARFTFMPAAGCQAPCDIVFTSISLNASSVEWDFDDDESVQGGTSVKHHYAYGKDFKVKLLARGVDGGSQGVTITVPVTPPPQSVPKADFNFTPDNDTLTAPVKISFSNRSENATRYEWTFGDPEAVPSNPNTSEIQDPQHTYIKEGTYTVTLKSFNKDNILDTELKEIKIKAKTLTADFNFSGGDCQVPCVVTFSDASINATSWFWDFGDNKTSTDRSPQHQYETAGTYTVKLTVTNAGNSNTKSKPVTINQPTVLTAISIKGSTSFGRDIVADGNGNVYVCGQADGQTNFGNGISMGSKGDGDFYVAKYDRTGKCLWVQKSGSGTWDEALKITLDDKNDVYIAGTIGGTLNNSFSPGVPYYGKYDAFVAKLNGGTGQVIWFRVIGGPGSERAEGLAYSAFNKRIYVAGTMTEGDVVFNPALDKQTADVAGDIFFTYVDAENGNINGNPSCITGNGFQKVKSLVADNEGNAYITGSFDQEVSFGSNPAGKLSTKGGVDAFAAKWAHNPGQWQWSAQAGSSGTDEGFDIAVDNSKNVYFTGTHNGYMVDLGVGSNGGNDINVFVSAWNSSGKVMWCRNGFNEGNADNAGGLAVNAAGNILVYGSYSGIGRFPFDNASRVSSTGATDLIITEIKPNDGMATGSFQKSTGGAAGEQPASVYVAPDGQIYATGNFAGNSNLNGISLNSGSVNEQNAFIIKFTP